MTFRGKPYLVEIGNNVPKKIVSSQEVSAEKLAVLDVLPEVVRAGEYVGSGEYVQHSAKKRPVVRYDYFETEVQIGERSDSNNDSNSQNWIVRFDVEVLPYANNYRTHQIVNVEMIPSEGCSTSTAPVVSIDRQSS